MSDNIDTYFNELFNSIETQMKQLTLLYVEDNKEAREASMLVLEEFFDIIYVAKDGEDGLEKFQQHNIDMVITDINMPNMDGILMCEKIRQIDQEVHLILLTAYNEAEFYDRSIKLNIDGYLLKPISITPLLSIFDKIATNIKLKQEAQANLHLLQQYQRAMDQNLIVSKTDTQGNITYTNDKFIETYGYTKDEIIGKNHNILRSSKSTNEMYKQMWDTIANKKETWTGLVGNKTKDGKISYSKTTISPIVDQDGNIIEYIALRQDVTDLV